MSRKSSASDYTAAPQIELRLLNSLVGYARNARTHSAAQVEQIKGSIVEFGFVGGIAIRDGVIAAGHGRRQAVRELLDAGVSIRFPNGAPIPDGMVPTINCDGWSEAQFRAYIIADNKLALNAGWDMEMLKVELGDLKAMDFDLGLTGFDVGEISLLLEPEGAAVDETPPEDFPSYDEEIETEFCCPRCSYRWSGKPNSGGKAVPAADEPDEG